MPAERKDGFMEPIFVMGHKNPDTDSIVSAMALSLIHT